MADDSKSRVTQRVSSIEAPPLSKLFLDRHRDNLQDWGSTFEELCLGGQIHQWMEESGGFASDSDSEGFQSYLNGFISNTWAVVRIPIIYTYGKDSPGSGFSTCSQDFIDYLNECAGMLEGWVTVSGGMIHNGFFDWLKKKEVNVNEVESLHIKAKSLLNVSRKTLKLHPLGGE